MTESEDPRADAGTPRYRRAQIALFCAAIATFAQIYSPQGLLPDISREFGVSEGTSSLAIGAATLGLAVGMLPWARLSDRIGRVPAMRWALVLAVIVGLIGPFAPNLELLVAVRFLEGVLLAGLPAIGVVALSETIAPRALGAAVGMFVGGNTIGGLLGRILAANVGERLGWHWGMFAVAVMATAAAALFLVLMPPTAIPAPPGLPMLRGTLANLRNSGVMAMVAQGFLLMGGFVAAYNYLAFRLQQEPFGWSLTQVSWIFLSYMAGAVASRGVWVFTRRRPAIGVLIASIAVMLVGLGLTMLPWIVAIVAGLVVFTMGFFGAHSLALALASSRASAGGKSLAPSLYYVGYYAGSTLLGWAGGVAFGWNGWGGTALMILIAAILSAMFAWIHAARRGGLGKADAAPE